MIVEEALAEGLADGGRSVADLELFVKVAEVRVHGAVADVELVRDFLLLETLSEELGDLKFPLGEGQILVGSAVFRRGTMRRTRVTARQAVNFFQCCFEPRCHP